MPIRVMIVEDHEAIRRYVSSVLRRNCRYEIVAEVVDGLEAVAIAERLRPDLVVLDIGLPTLSGIEAARRIRAMAPDSRILFFTEQRSADVADAALATGADGYVLKSDAAEELLPAIEAVIHGKQFISARMADHLAPNTHSKRFP